MNVFLFPARPPSRSRRAFIAGTISAAILAGIGLPARAQTSNTFSSTGTMTTARLNHTATLLPNGKVLVAGGVNRNLVTISSVELYDPSSGTWATTAPLNGARQRHTATLLPNGNVLVTGGYSGSSVLNTAEVFNPVRGTWTTITFGGPARENHTATLLRNGKVLIVGGKGLNDPLTDARLYDPATGTSPSTGSLAHARQYHTATLLPDGKVLVAGGDDVLGTSLNTAELYDPATGTWSPTGNLNVARTYHTATLLPNGKVLVAGGRFTDGSIIGSEELYDPATGTWSFTADAGARQNHTATVLPNGKVLAAGGASKSGASLASAELYDPTTGNWSNTGSLVTARVRFTATVLANGKVLIVGGENNIALATAELYEPASATWSATGSLATARSGTATLLPTGKILAAGGTSNTTATELYDPATGTWSATGNLNSARIGHTATLLPNGKVLVVGGHNSTTRYLASAELYDPGSGTWSVTGSLTTPRRFHTATLLRSGKVLVAGGQNSTGFLTSTELYDPATGTWSPAANLANAREAHTATLLTNGKVLVAGGDGGNGVLSSAELYDPASGTWSATGNLITTRRFHTATLLPNGKVMVAGGYSSSGNSVSPTAELYDPANATWSSTGSLATAREDHSATLLSNGNVLVAGGDDGAGGVFASAELFDPASGSWSATASLATARHDQMCTLLLNQKVLVAGGATGSGASATTELYDVGLGYSAAWQPQITGATSALASGQELAVSGVGFQGISQGSYGGSRDSSTNYPVIQLRALQSSQVSYFLVDSASGWSNTSFTSVPVSGFTYGYAMVTVFTNGIPSNAAMVLVTEATPQLTSNASTGTLGGQISNTATLSGGNNPTGTITFSLYGPSDATCASTAVFTSTKPVSGLGDFTSGSYTVTQAGTYHWIVSYSGDSNNNAISTTCSDPSGSVTISKATPGVAGQASGATAAGGTVFDTATVSGGYSPNGTITFSLYGPNDDSCSATAVFTSTKSVSGDGNYSSDSYTVTQAGTYHWIATYNGDGNNNLVSTTCSSASETFTVSKASPGLSTLSSGSPTTGGTLSNSATVFGGSNPTGTVTFNLYGPNDNTCSATPIFTSTKSLDSNGHATSDGYTVGAPGSYYWIVAYNGDSNNNSISTSCTNASQSGTVTKATPVIVAQTFPSAVVGGILSDIANVSAGYKPSGTVTFSLYGPNDNSCGAGAIFTSTKPLDSNGNAASDPYTVTAPGSYHWIASYSGDSNNNSTATACANASQAVTVSKATPTLTTTASAGVQLGSSISDTAVLDGGFANSGTLTFRLYGPDDSTCGGSIVFSSTANVNGNGTYLSGAFTPTAAGTYRWIASYTGDSNNNAVAGGCNDANESVVVSPTPTPTPTATVSPTPTATPSAAQPLNISTRMEVLQADNVLIAGFIVTGSPGTTKQVMIRGLGPSLAAAGVPNPLSDPFLELHDGTGVLMASNNDWQDASNASDIPNGFQPTDPRESVIIATLTVGSQGFSNYTAIVRGAQGETGIGLVEAYDLQSGANQFANISTRGFIDTGANVMIGGFILGGSNTGSKVLIRAIGPSLAAQNVTGVLSDPTLEIHDANGVKIRSNDNWKIDDATGQSQEAAIVATTIPPSNDLESAIVDTFQPGAYTAIVAGKNGGTGIGLVEVYNLGAP